MMQSQGIRRRTWSALTQRTKAVVIVYSLQTPDVAWILTWDPCGMLIANRFVKTRFCSDCQQGVNVTEAELTGSWYCAKLSQTT